jgi:hypothetical protein
MRIALLMLALLVTAPWAMAQTVNLTYAPQPAEEAQSYVATLEGALDAPQAQDLALSASTVLSFQVLEVGEEGALRQLTFGDTEVSVAGQKGSGAEGTQAKLLIDGRGLLAKAVEPLPAGMQEGLDGLAMFTLLPFEFALPAKEVAVGDTWEITVKDAPSMFEQDPADKSTDETTYKGTLVSFADGTATVEVGFESKGDDGAGNSGTLKGKTTSHYDVATWTLIDAETTFDYDVVQSGMTVKIHDVKIKVEPAE